MAPDYIFVRPVLIDKLPFPGNISAQIMNYRTFDVY